PLVTAIRLTDAILHCEAPRTSVPSPIARSGSVCIGAIVVAVIATMIAVPWIAYLHLYAWTGEINSLSLGRCESASSHRAVGHRLQHEDKVDDPQPGEQGGAFFLRQINDADERRRQRRLEKRTCAVQLGMSALGHKRTLTFAAARAAIPLALPF